MFKSLKILLKDEFILLSLLTLFFLNISLSNVYITLALLLYLLFIYTKVGLSVDYNSVLLLLFGIAYSLGGFSSDNLSNSYFFLWITICPIILYQVGLYLGRIIESENCFFELILYLSVLFSIIHLFSVFYDISINGFSSLDRNLHIFFMRDLNVNSLATATVVGVMISPLLVYLPIFLFTHKSDKFSVLIFGAAFSILALIAAFRLVSRTSFLVFILLCLIIFLYNYRNMPIQGKFSGMVLLLILVYFALKFDFEKSEMTSALYSRVVDSEDLSSFGYRSTKWVDGIKNIFAYPLGGNYTIGYNYYHNLWLDVFRVSGIVPMFFLVLFTLSSIRVVLKFSKNQYITYINRTLVISLFIVFLSLSFVEPIIEGAFNFFLFYCFFVGLVKRYGVQKYSFLNRKTYKKIAL